MRVLVPLTLHSWIHDEIQRTTFLRSLYRHRTTAPTRLPFVGRICICLKTSICHERVCGTETSSSIICKAKVRLLVFVILFLQNIRYIIHVRIFKVLYKYQNNMVLEKIWQIKLWHLFMIARTHQNESYSMLNTINHWRKATVTNVKNKKGNINTFSLEG